MSCKTLFFYSFLLLLFTACGPNKKEASFSGGTFSVCMKSRYLMTDPSMIDDYTTGQILGQVYEGLVSFNTKNLSIQPQLAKKYTIKNKGLVYEFTLRNDVYFHDFGAREEERKFTAEDVKFTIEHACKPDNKNNPSAAYSLVFRDKLKGADAFYEGKTKQISGLKIKGNKVTLELLRYDHSFLEKLSQACCAIVSKKFFKEKGKHIGTGPFMLLPEFETPEKLTCVKNPEYYLFDSDGNALPYLDTLEFIIEPRKLAQLELFENKKIDIISGLPTSRITEMLEGRIEDFQNEPPLLHLDNSASLRTDYYFFDMTDPRFQDTRVRQAFNLAIDKRKIGQNILHNQYYELGYYGIVPPLKNLFRGYDFEGVKSNAYDYNPEKARRLLAEAGYPGGKGFGTIILRFNIDDVHSAVADEFAKQIASELGIIVNIDGSTYERLSMDQETGNGEIFRTAWVADYPNPESFLQKFAGKFVPRNQKQISLLNNSRYVNPLFDNYFEKAIHSTKVIDRRKYFALAEIELMKDPPLIPLWYTGEMSVIYKNVRNFYFNSLGLYDFRSVYIKEWTKEEYVKSRNRK
jgi:oligopeptide transport system substrate-binding protein